MYKVVVDNYQGDTKTKELIIKTKDLKHAELAYKGTCMRLMYDYKKNTPLVTEEDYKFKLEINNTIIIVKLIKEEVHNDRRKDYRKRNTTNKNRRYAKSR